MHAWIAFETQGFRSDSTSIQRHRKMFKNGEEWQTVSELRRMLETKVSKSMAY